MTIRIKNMVCNRCVLVVKNELERMGLVVKSVRLGEAEIEGDLVGEMRGRAAARLGELGFELIEDRRAQLVEAVKNCIVAWVHTEGTMAELHLSDYLAQRLPYDYKYLSTLFSETQGRTVENFLIAQKIERVKELLAYGELTLSEIAFRMGYSSVAHLSAQFKRVAGCTPSAYKRARVKARKPLDEV